MNGALNRINSTKDLVNVCPSNSSSASGTRRHSAWVRRAAGVRPDPSQSASTRKTTTWMTKTSLTTKRTSSMTTSLKPNCRSTRRPKSAVRWDRIHRRLSISSAPARLKFNSFISNITITALEHRDGMNQPKSDTTGFFISYFLTKS